MVFKDFSLLEKESVSHSNLQRKIERVQALVESIDLSSPISAKLLLVATIIEVASFNEELWQYHNVVEEYYLPDLAEKPTFASLGQKLKYSADKLYGSDLAGCFRRYESLSLEERNKATEYKIKVVNHVLSGAQKKFNQLIEDCNQSGSYKKMKDDLSKADNIFSTGIPDLVGLLNYICFTCSSISTSLSEIIEKPSFKSLKNGLELETESYLSHTFPEKIKQFNKDKERALDEYDENSTERITEEIKYLQEKKKEIQNNCNKNFFDVWKECMDPKTNSVNYEGVINKLRPDRDAYVEDIMNDARFKSNLKEVYLYDFITSEIKRLKGKQRQMQEPKEVVVKHEAFFDRDQIIVFNGNNHEEPKGQKQMPVRVELKSFKHNNKFVCEKVKVVIDKFYFDSAANLALIETTFYDHDLIKKKNKHKEFLKDLIKMNALNMSDEEICRTANGMSVKMRNLPKKGYLEWPDDYQNEKDMCSYIGDNLGATIPYKRITT